MLQSFQDVLERCLARLHARDLQRLCAGETRRRDNLRRSCTDAKFKMRRSPPSSVAAPSGVLPCRKAPMTPVQSMPGDGVAASSVTAFTPPADNVNPHQSLATFLKNPAFLSKRPCLAVRLPGCRFSHPQVKESQNPLLLR